MNILTKEQFIDALRKIREKGWVPNARPGNAGGVGNTLEDLLGIQENLKKGTPTWILMQELVITMGPNFVFTGTPFRNCMRRLEIYRSQKPSHSSHATHMRRVAVSCNSFLGFNVFQPRRRRREHVDADCVSSHAIRHNRRRS